MPKKLLVEHGAPTVADKRQINEGIDALLWLATLKPTTIGVPEYRDDTREYLEIAVLHLLLRPGAKAKRLNELTHRAIPYPVWLVTGQGPTLTISLAHKRWSQNEAGRMVLDGEVVAAELDGVRDGAHWPAFRDALGLGGQPRLNLHSLYQGWMDVLLAIQAARLTGVFRVATEPLRVAARRAALRESLHLKEEIAHLKAAAMKEKQIAKRLELNLALKRAEANLVQAHERL